RRRSIGRTTVCIRARPGHRLWRTSGYRKSRARSRKLKTRQARLYGLRYSIRPFRGLRLLADGALLIQPFLQLFFEVGAVDAVYMVGAGYNFDRPVVARGLQRLNIKSPDRILLADQHRNRQANGLQFGFA